MDYGYRHDGKSKKGSGYFGEIKNKHGDVMTELTIGVNIDGEELEIPTLVPTLTPEEIEQLRNLDEGSDIPENIVDIAIGHAMQRRKEGRSVFADKMDSAGRARMRRALGL